MIFATVGTNHARFGRMLEALAAWPGTEELVVQHGPVAVERPGAVLKPYLSFDEMVSYIEESRLVVTHAGVGSILLALAHGKGPIVVPRLRRYGEAVDDHQLVFARRLDEDGLVTMVDLSRPSDLWRALDSAASSTAVRRNGGNRLVADLRDYLTSNTGA